MRERENRHSMAGEAIVLAVDVAMAAAVFVGVACLGGVGFRAWAGDGCPPWQLHVAQFVVFGTACLAAGYVAERLLSARRAPERQRRPAERDQAPDGFDRVWEGSDAVHWRCRRCGDAWWVEKGKANG